MPNLTKRFVESLPPVNRDKIYWDDSISGFGVKVTPRGALSYLFKYRSPSGMQRKPKIGSHGSITCEQARKIAQEWSALVSNGKDPMEQRDRAKAELTFDELFNIYMERHAKPHKKSWLQDEQNYALHVKQAIGNKPLSVVEQSDIVRLHNKIATENGKTMANRILALIRLVYNRGVEWNHTYEPIPTKHVKKFREKARERFLQGDELPRFFKALAAEENTTVRDFIYLLLYTGARRSNALTMRWDDVDLKQRQWHIPETKNGETQTVPLVPQAMSILKARKKNSGASPWIFTGTGNKGHLADPKKGWKRLLGRAEIENLTMHDLRRTMGSYQTIMGASAFIVGKSLGHKSMSSTQIYARLNLDPVQQSMEIAVNAMLKAGGKA